jgi:tetratricopeptide (TPR) repeat protein
LHQDVGNVLEALYGEQAAEIAVQLGRHFDEAGLTEKAIFYLRLAAERAMRVSANIEAIDHLTRALDLLQTLPASAEHDRLELPLQIGLAAATSIAHGPLPSVQAALDRARELCCGTECSVQLIPVLRQLYLHHHARADHRGAYALAKELLSLVEQTADPVSRVMAYGALGQTQVQLGDIVAGRDTLERGLAYYNPERFRDLAYLYGEEFGVTASAYLGVALFLLGYPDQGLARMRKALDITEALAHPHVMAMALYAITFLHLLRREGQPAEVLAERGITLCDAKGIPLWRAVLSINHAHALTLQGRVREGIAEGPRSLAAYRAMGARLFVPFLLAQVAEMHLLAGQVEEGLAVVPEVQLAMDDTGEHKVEAEMYRLRAELLARQGHEAEAETDWQQALAVARRQQTRSFELRAALGLCRLWRRQGKRDEARRLLGDIYGWFTEGFDTPDLQEAKALLEEFAQPV